MQVPDKLFINGTIYTMDKENRIVQALAVEGDTITAIGSDEEILKLKSVNTEVIDLKGRTVIPGLIDSHAHILWTGVSEVDGEMFIPQSIDELLNYVREMTSTLPDGEWIHLKNVYPTRLKEHRYPTVEELDRVSPSHPVFVDGAYAGQANSCARKVVGLSGGTPSLNAISLIKKHIREPLYDIEDYKRGIQNIQREYNKLGITSIVDGISNEIGVKAAGKLCNEGELSVRLTFTKVVGSKETAIDEMARFENIIDMPYKWGRLAFMKILIDGGILTGTSYMRRPYQDTLGMFGMEEGFRGIANHDTESVMGFIDAAYKSGYQMTAHCIGDGALDILLNGYQRYQDMEDIRDRRFSIIHGDFTDDKALDIIKDLNLILLFQPAWHFKDAAILKEMLDEETFSYFLPYSKYVDKGIYGAAGSDHMVKYDPLLSQNPYHPFWALYNMVTGNTIEGEPIGEMWKISREDALRFYTIGGAYATFDENIKGTLEPGKLADFAVLSDNYFTCPEKNIPQITSLLTVVGGVCVYCDREEY